MTSITRISCTSFLPRLHPRHILSRPPVLSRRLFSSTTDDYKPVEQKPNTIDPKNAEASRRPAMLAPVLGRLYSTSETLRTLRAEVRDPKEALQRLARALNEFTGYTQIERLKVEVAKKAEAFDLSREHLHTSKQRYEATIDVRSRTQREINELLQRKHQWNAEDVTRFTELYRSEHTHAQEETTAKEEFHRSEKAMDHEYLELTRLMMERYHEEQLWSDKIRGASTYGTWALLVANVFLFMAVQIVFEPWKRKRLADRFEELLVSKVEEEEGKFGEVLQALRGKEEELTKNQEMLFGMLEGRLEKKAGDRAVAGMGEGVDVAIVGVPEIVDDDTTRRGIIFYGIPGAIAGGVVTALIAYFMR